jgi:glucosamine-6-phosphate deaminase
MDEWVENGRAVPATHPLSFEKADRELCFDRIKPGLRPREEHLHFPHGDLSGYSKAWEVVRCVVMQGGQGEIKHWAFNDPPKREGQYKDAPPSLQEYRSLRTRIVDLHPVTLVQNARTSGGGNLAGVPSRAISVGPYETWKAEKVSIWHAGNHDNPFGQRLTAFMISKRLPDAAVPMSLLADHPNVQFNYYRRGIGSCEVEMH